MLDTFVPTTMAPAPFAQPPPGGGAITRSDRPSAKDPYRCKVQAKLGLLEYLCGTVDLEYGDCPIITIVTSLTTATWIVWSLEPIRRKFFQ